MSKLKGLVPGGEKTSHASGNDITYTIQESGRKVKIEGDEYHLCASALQSEKIHEFKDMTTKEVLDEIYTLHSCNITPGKANTGDFIVCKVAVRNPERRNWTGTVKELLNIMQSKYGCNLAYTGKEKYDMGGPVELLAPNGKPSNLTPEQYKLVRTPEFKAWFGDFEKAYETGSYDNVSKVIDEETKEPLVVYHGTDEQFYVFDKEKIGSKNPSDKAKLGFWFTSELWEAEGFAYGFDESMRNDSGRVVASFLNIRQPLYVDEKNVQKNIDKKYSKENDISGMYIEIHQTEIKKSLNKKNDGIVLNPVFIAFEPNQIKLADGTNTTFDGENPDIRFEEGGELKDTKSDILNAKDEDFVYVYHASTQPLNFIKTGNQKNFRYSKGSMVYVATNPENAAGYVRILGKIPYVHKIKIKKKELKPDSGMIKLHGGKNTLSDSISLFGLATIHRDIYGNEIESVVKFDPKEKLAKGGNISVNPAKTPEEVAMMHGVSPEYIRYQAETGTESEMKEHGCDRNTAYTLTMHHLEVNPDCYCLNDFTGVDKMNAGGMMIAKVMPGAIENSRKSFECGYAMFKKYGSGKKSLSEFINGLREKTPDNKSFWDEYQNCLKQSMENTGELAKEAFAHGGKVEPAGIKAYRYYVGENAFIPSENPKNKYGRGIYFSTNPERFREHGRKMIEAVITPKNPAVFESRHLPNLNYITAMREKGFTDKNDFNKSLFSAGHDAIIIKHSPAFGDEIILMDAKPVTSAIIMDGIMKDGGKAGKIKFDKNDIPSKRIYEYTQILKENYPKVWALGGNVFGNKAYKNLEKVLKRGYWLESEEWMYVKWKSFAARHAGDFLIAGIIANLKWMVWPARGSEYCKEVIREEIMKKYPEKEVLLQDGGEIANHDMQYPVMQDPETGEITRIMDKATELLENVRNITGATDGYTEIALDEDGDTMLSLYVEGDTGEKPGKVGNHFLSIVISDKQPTSYDIREFVFDSTNSAEEIIEFINEKIAELQEMEGIEGYPVKMEKGGYAGDTVTMNIPLLMRVFEQVREDVQDDKELHFMVERILDITRKGVLTMEDYDYISGALQNPKMQEEIADAGYEVQEMKKGGVLNKYAICTASLGRVHGMQRSLWDDETMEKYERCLESVEKRMEKGGSVVSNKSFDEAVRRYKELAGRGQDPTNFIQSEFDISLALGQEYLEFYLAFSASDLSGKKLPAKQRLTAPEEIKGDTEIPLKLKEKSVKFAGIRDRVDILDLLKKIVGKDDLRPSMQGVYFDEKNKAAVATDAHKLIFLPDDTIKKTEIINPYDGKVIDEKFPDWKMVVPQDNQIDHKIRVSVQYMLNVLHTVENSGGFLVKPPFVVINHGGEQYGFNAHIMYPVFEVMAKMGVDYATIGLISPRRGVLIESDTKSVTGLVMPIILGLEQQSYSGYPGIYTILDNGTETKSLPGGFAKSVKAPVSSEPTKEQVREFMETLGILADSGDKNAAEFLETLKIVYA